MTHSLPSVRAQLALDWMCGIIDSKIYCLIVYCFFCFGWHCEIATGWTIVTNHLVRQNMFCIRAFLRTGSWTTMHQSSGAKQRTLIWSLFVRWNFEECMGRWRQFCCETLGDQSSWSTQTGWYDCILVGCTFWFCTIVTARIGVERQEERLQKYGTQFYCTGEDPHFFLCFLMLRINIWLFSLVHLARWNKQGTAGLINHFNDLLLNYYK